MQIKYSRRGFSLVELAIVITIIGVLMLATLGMGAGQMEIAKIKATQDKLSKIQVAMKAYFLTKGALPCPANGALGTSDPNYGYGTNGPVGTGGVKTCAVTSIAVNPAPGAIYRGVVPVKDLGLSDEFMFDSWGNRISYAASNYCVNPGSWSSNHKYKCAKYGTNGKIADENSDGSNIQLQDLSGTTLTNGNARGLAAYILISHGKNGVGAFAKIPSTSRVPSTSTTSIKEKANAHVNTSGGDSSGGEAYDSVYVDGAINDGSNETKYFDDIVLWQNAALFAEDLLTKDIDPGFKGKIITQSGDLAAMGPGGSNGFQAYPVSLIIPAGAKYLLVNSTCETRSVSGGDRSMTRLVLNFKSGGVIRYSAPVCGSDAGDGRLITGGSVFQKIPAIPNITVECSLEWQDNDGAVGWIDFDWAFLE